MQRLPDQAVPEARLETRGSEREEMRLQEEMKQVGKMRNHSIKYEETSVEEFAENLKPKYTVHVSD